MNRKALADRMNDKVPRTEKVARHPMALIKMTEREDMPQPTKLPHCRMELAVARFESGKYSESNEKDNGLKAAAITPRSTLLVARKPKESMELTAAIVAPEPAIASASPVFLLTKGVIRPKKRPRNANGTV